MENQKKSVEKMWQAYCQQAQQPVQEDEIYDVYHFCNDKESANALAELVKTGRKTGTSSLYRFYELEDEELPQVGSFSIITDWEDEAQCIIRNIDVVQKRFCDVTADFARKEGEGDLSLDYWQRVHRDFFSKELEEIGETFQEDMLVVCEEFEVVYK